MNNTTWNVNLINSETGEVEKVFEAQTKRAAERIDDGLNINLNHDKYYTEVVRAKDTP